MQHLEQYLTGKKDTSEYILPDQLPQQLDQSVQKAGSRPGKADDAKHVAAAGQDDKEDVALKTILSNELQLRNRNTMLSVTGRSFDKVLDILRDVAREELQLAAKANRGAAKAVVGPRSSGRFERQTATDATMKQIGAQSLGIQNVGFGGSAPKAPAKSEPSPQKREQAIAPLMPAAIPRPMKRAKESRPKATPLILVPPATSALINMINVREFLETGNFMSSEEALSKGAKKRPYERCTRTEGRNAPVKYHITDKDPSKQEDWDRVVAVFCLGKAWQFKKWPFEGASTGDMVATFMRVAGLYVHYTDEPIDPLVKTWNVKMISIGRHSRSGDGGAMREIWSHIDAFIKSNNINVEY